MLKKYLLPLSGILVGAIAGYLYFHYRGCSGNCAITSKPLNSTVYGALMGGLLFSMFGPGKNKDKNKNEHTHE